MENPTIEQWLDRAAFVSAPRGSFGDSGVGILRAPGFWNVDMSVSKRFMTFGRQFLMFRGEVFNALNHPNFGAAAGQYPEHGIRHDHEHGWRCADRAVWW